MSDTALLHVAGFTIAIRLRKTEPFHEKAFRKLVLCLYQGFVTEQVPKTIHYTIDVVERGKIEGFIHKQTRKYFVNCYEEKSSNHVITFYHVSIAQFEIIVRKALHTLLDRYNGFLLHASASEIDGKAYLFLGKAGGGKSTSARILLTKYPRIADDTIILREEDNRFFVYKSPLRERRPFIEKTSERIALGKVFFLRKSSQYKITKLEGKDRILELFIKQGFFLGQQEAQKQLRWAFNFVAKWNEFYTLSFSLQNPKSMIELLAQSSYEKI